MVSNKPRKECEFLEVVCKTIESDGWCKCSGQRISDLQIILAADCLADIAPRSGILHGWVVGPFRKFMSDNGDVCKTLTMVSLRPSKSATTYVWPGRLMVPSVVP